MLGEEEDGWWRGQIGDRVGLFPSNFVEIITEETTPPTGHEPPAAAPPPLDSADGASHPPPDRPRTSPSFISMGACLVSFCNVLPSYNHTVTSSPSHHHTVTPPPLHTGNPPPVGGVLMGAGPNINLKEVKLKKTAVSLKVATTSGSPILTLLFLH